ncbi:MAG TPA: ABC transporter permease [Vicinamibacterales bacterium]|nr:ABC transporter permease [Vicinamibacterales bacterium]
MITFGERVFRLLLRAYPREFRERYAEDLLAFFREDRRHPRYGSGPLRPVRFWWAAIRDLARVAGSERLTAGFVPPLHGRAVIRTVAALGSDLRHAARSLRATPAVTLTALVVLTLGIGAGTAIFAVVDGVVLRGLPFADEASLVAINEVELATGRPGPAAYPNFADWSRRQDVFEAMAASTTGPWLTTTDERPERLRSHKITANLLDLLRIRPAIGPGISAEEERTGARVVLLTDAVWRRRFNADPAVVGRTLRFDTGTYVVAGVMPPGFTYPIGPAIVSAVDLWIPLSPSPKDLARTPARTYSLRVIGRLKPGVSIAHASARMQQIRNVLAVDHPGWFVDRGVIVRPIKDSIVTKSAQSWMLMLLGAVTAVFLVACANVANLLLARAVGRSHEIGVRAAIGATRGQIIRVLLVESVVLALAGAAGGLLLAFWGVDVLRATLPANLSRVSTIAVDLRVAGVATLVALSTGVLCGLLPALQMSRTDAASVLRSGGRSATTGTGRQRIRTVFLATEVALAAILLVGAGLFASSFLRLVRTDLGFSSERVLSVIVSPKLPTSGETADDARQAFQSSMALALERIQALPGIESAALVAGGAPLTGSWSTRAVRAAGRTFENDDEVVLKQVTDDYLDTVGATLLKGRSLGAADSPGAPQVVVLNDEAARRYLGDRDPLGARIAIENEPPRTVVGIVRGMRLLGPESDVQPEAYVPYAQSPVHSVSASLVLRSAQDPSSAIPATKNAIWTVMPGVVIPEPQTFDGMFAALIAQRKLNMILLGIFGALAVLIASLGIYGMLAYLVEQRTKEIGVRMALGAVPSRILGMILGRAALTIGAGLGAGFLAAAWLERLVMTFVYRGIPHDPAVYGSAGLLLLALGLLAAYLPARRAARVDPLVALRSE